MCVYIIFRAGMKSVDVVGAAYCAMDLMILLDSSGSVRDHQIPNTTDNWNVSKARKLIEFLHGVSRSARK